MRHLFIVFGLSFAAATVGHAVPQSELLLELDRLLSGPAPLKVEACATELARWTERFESARARGPATIALTDTFRARGALRASLRAWTKGARRPVACVDQLRRTLSVLRRAEDQAALAKSRAWVPNAAPTLRSGDVIMSRGNAFVSAAIAKIGRVEGDFSHLAQIYIDAPAGTLVSYEQALTDPRVFTVEAHIEVGSFTRPFAEYVHDRNGRMVHLRPRQSAADAHLAAKTIFDWVRAYQKAHATAYHRDVPTVDDNPPYDFQMDTDNPTAVFCAEVVSIAQAAVGWRVPRFESTLKQNQVTEIMGITKARTFAPSDLELDPRFDVLVEGRDLAKLPAILRKDLVIHELYARMARGEFRFEIDPVDRAKAFIAWIVRQNGLGFHDRLTKAMPIPIIELSFAIEREGQRLEATLK